MPPGVPSPTYRCVAVFNFTVANGGFLRLAGANQTAPTQVLVPASFGATWNNGIPQDANKTRLAETARDTNGHRAKHVVVRVVSTAGAVSGPGAFSHNGGLSEATDPSATKGARIAVGDEFTIRNSPEQIFNFAGINNSGGAMEIDVEVYE